jgi:hypothetical protein
VFHRFVNRSTIFKLIISLNEWNLSILIELRLLVREHKSVAGAILAMEIVLVGKATEAILLILPLHLMNLSLQIRDFLLSSAAATLRVLSILLPETARIDLYIIP